MLGIDSCVDVLQSYANMVYYGGNLFLHFVAQPLMVLR
jgi:hypothetical protein